MRIYIDKCGYNFNKAAATIENALTFTEGKYFDSCAALKKITKASLALYEMATPSTPPPNPSDKCLAFVEKADFDYHEAMFNLLVAAKTINDIAAALVNAEMNKASQS